MDNDKKVVKRVARYFKLAYRIRKNLSQGYPHLGNNLTDIAKMVQLEELQGEEKAKNERRERKVS